jgi:hypothetical protein
LKKIVWPVFAILAGCTATAVVPKGNDGTYFQLKTYTTESKSTCQVLVDGSGNPYVFRGALYAKRAPSCQWGQRLQGKELKVSTDLIAKRDEARVVWDTGASVLKINEYGQVRVRWAPN